MQVSILQGPPGSPGPQGATGPTGAAVSLLFPDVAQIDGWMVCNFTSFLTVFQSYQDDRWMIMKGYVQWNPVYN